MRRLAAVSLSAVMLIAVALTALAWDGKGYGDCDGWHITNPAAKWNSADWEMVIFPVGLIVGYGDTKFIPPTNDETSRTFQLAWRLIGDGDNYQHQATLKLSRDLTECTPTSTTEAPPSSTTTTSLPESSSTTTTETTSTTTVSTSTSTTVPTPEITDSSTSTTSNPAPTITADTTSSTSSPTTTDPPAELPHTGIGSGALTGLAGVMGLGGLWLIGRRGE